MNANVVVLFCLICYYCAMKITKQKKAEIVKAYLDTLYPDPKCELNFNSNFQLLVAVVLSAQCTDKRVNEVTPVLFEKYPNPRALANAKQEDVEKIIYSCGFYTQKAKSIIEASKDITTKFNGQVPDNLQDLTSLRGVGRKTANVVLSVAFKKPAIAVDTHVFRMAKRFGLSNGKTVWEVEKDLMKLFKQEDWAKLHYQLVLYGRYKSKARGKSDWEEEFLSFQKKYLETQEN